MKKALLALLVLCMPVASDHLKKGDSILNPQIILSGEVNHAFVFSYDDSDGFGFVSTRIYDFRIAYEPVFDTMYIFGRSEPGCLVWVKKNGKWGVIDMDDYHMVTPFCYDTVARFREVSADLKTKIGVYQTEVPKDGVMDTIRVEKYLCISFYEY